MSIASLNRSSVSRPLSSPSPLKPAATPAQGVVGTPTQQPRNDLWRKLMTDSFEQGPSKAGGASGGFEKELSQLVGQLMQLAKGLETQALGGQGGDLGQEAQGVPSIDAFEPQSPAPAASPDTAQATAQAHPTSASDAGPGFGPPSAGSTEPAPANAPWLAKNNVGSPYNSNMQLIDPGQKGQFKYTNTFTNKTNEPQTLTLWNKTGEHGGPNDGQNFDKSTPKTFTLQPGQSQVVAFDNNSSVAWCASKDGSAKPGANSGQTWGEATFANSGTGWSGYDTSQISPAGHTGKMSITNEATGVTVTEANAWQTEKDDPAGHDIGVPAGPLNLKTDLG
ncbi:hypothetical protein [Corallococcus llansteffanensis]|uniref:Uncharacterized protein n=1 Tax=Corallococcus llansteffanensis TaxID=2316731 RepID=A0A3A8PPA5_9BACT|nr:hypothetical protein [Corallococcus llansteffanensis]RKH57999.1 hypothetical protein D7V93_17545 [Corallococcus llansteffanensis]